MVKVEVVESLAAEIDKRFKKESVKVFKIMKSLEDNPRKGKVLGGVGGIVVKELKYKSYRFYFLADGYKLKFFNEAELVDLLLMFVRMSDKKHQQKTIDEIKGVLIKIGPRGFS
jgi:hypothetical protein